MEICKKLSMPDFLSILGTIVGVVLVFGAMGSTISSNTNSINEIKTNVVILADKYNSIDIFKSNQNLTNENQKLVNERLEKALIESSHVTQELTNAVGKLQVYLEKNK